MEEKSQEALMCAMYAILFFVELLPGVVSGCVEDARSTHPCGVTFTTKSGRRYSLTLKELED